MNSALVALSIVALAVSVQALPRPDLLSATASVVQQATANVGTDSGSASVAQDLTTVITKEADSEAQDPGKEVSEDQEAPAEDLTTGGTAASDVPSEIVEGGADVAKSAAADAVGDITVIIEDNSHVGEAVSEGSSDVNTEVSGAGAGASDAIVNAEGGSVDVAAAGGSVITEEQH